MVISAESWKQRGRVLLLREGGVWAAAVGEGAEETTPVLTLHGFPTSSWDFHAVAALVPNRKLVVFDFPGYGLSDKPKAYSYSLFEQADVVLQVAREFGLRRVHLWAHDMGTSVATELLARRERGLLPLDLASVTLMNGSAIVELAHLTPGQRILRSPLGPLLARATSKTTFKPQLRAVFAKKPSDEEMEIVWQLVARQDGPLRFPTIIRYLDERARFRERWIGAFSRLDAPALIAWGKLDPVAVTAIAEGLAAANPRAEKVYWNDLGHYPHLESPGDVAATLVAFWDRVDKG